MQYIERIYHRLLTKTRACHDLIFWRDLDGIVSNGKRDAKKYFTKYCDPLPTNPTTYGSVRIYK
jgi:hypothetical protein